MPRAEGVAYDFHGRIALVTGSSRGIGRATALHLARCGADVVLHYRRDEAAARDTQTAVAALGRRAWVLRADLQTASALDGMMATVAAEVGRLDVVVANAAATAFKPILELQPHNVGKTLDAVVQACVTLVQRAVPLMPAQGGSIVTVSGFDTLRVLPGHGMLAAAKAALEALTRYLAVELAPRGITVNGVVPGFVDTDSARLWAARSGEDPAARARATPRGRLASPEEIARVIVFLCSDDARWIVGQSIVADGGLTLV